ncbi:DUF805 domain-containing protein [Avibacterium avium]|uniref:DUF805 domain-containing protein n=1 Tax=Avibacterium avium TaxID=751 RepID=UPI003BF7C5E3
MRRTRINYSIRFILTTAITCTLYPYVAAPGVLSICGIAFSIYLAAGRLEDMNVNPLWSILSVLPFVSFILIFPKGTKGTNKYGKDPRDSKEQVVRESIQEDSLSP